MKYLSRLTIPEAPFDVKACWKKESTPNSQTWWQWWQGSLVVPCVHGVLSSPVIQCVASEYNWHSRRRRGESEMHRLGEVGSLLNIGDFFFKQKAILYKRIECKKKSRIIAIFKKDKKNKWSPNRKTERHCGLKHPWEANILNLNKKHFHY